MTTVTVHMTYKHYMFLLTFVCACRACSEIQFSASDLNMKLQGQVFEERRVTGLSKCIYDCMVTTDCVSVNYELHTRWCEMNSGDSLLHNGSLESTSGRILFSDIKRWPEVVLVDTGLVGLKTVVFYCTYPSRDIVSVTETVARQCKEIQCSSGHRCYPGTPPRCSIAVFQIPCPDSYKYALGYRLCYKLVIDPKLRYTDAQDFCQSEGGDLLQIKTEQEYDIIIDYLWRDFPGISPVIAGRRGEQSRPFVNSDGMPLTFFKWMEGHPGSGNCLQLTHSETYKFKTRGCVSDRTFMCQIRVDEN